MTAPNPAVGAGALAEAIVEHLSPAAAPAPLDPGNPEHLRQVRDFLGQVGMRIGYPMQAMAEKYLTEGRAVTVEVQSASGTYLNEVDASVALLDPGNPEDLREVDKFLGRFYASIGIASSSAGSVCKQLRSVADRLDREQREAEQEVAEEAFVQGIYERWCASDGTDHDLIREAIRAERACQADLAAIELPTPNEREDDDTATTWGEPYNDLQVGVHDEYADQVQVWVDYEPIEPWSPHEAEEFASHLLAAAKRARQEAGQ